jgi:general secretion pathway protein D
MNDRKNKMAAPLPRWALLAAPLLTALSACVSGGGAPSDALAPRAAASAPRVAQPAVAPVAQPPLSSSSPASDPDRVKMALGSDRTFRVPQAKTSAADEAPGPIVLNVENGDIREIVRNLLGDALGEGFIIDPAVTGTVTVRTAKGLKRTDIIPILETLLRSVRAVLVKDGNYWRVLPETAANLGTVPPSLQLRAGAGNGVVILPVKHISAKELEKLILPFVKPGAPAAIRTDELRNLMFLSGTEAEIRNMLEIAEMFDVNILSGMSFLLFPLESSDVKSIVADWEKIFPATANPFSGLLRVVPIERMNAVLLISPQRDMILEARQWLERLDKGTDAGGGARLYVYYVQYGQADKLQAILQQAITGRATPATTQPTVAPGQTPSNVVAPVSPFPGQPIFTPGNQQNNPAVTPARPAAAATTATGAAANSQAIGLARNATVIADKDRNALLIVGTPSEYAAIESAIKKLDTPPKQVAIEVQIAQIQLTGDLSFGLSGLFKGFVDSPINRLTSANGVGSIAAATSTAAGGAFNYTWTGAAANVALNTLQTTKQIRTIASPTLITLDNQVATFNSGQSISVVTGTTSTPTTTGSTTSNVTQYIPTGVKLSVTPRVSGTNVFLQIQQSISSASPSASGTNPDIDDKSVSTTVMVPSGDTILMGGFIQDKGNNGTSGLPFVSTIPVLGGLFGSQNWNADRTEVIMLITPRIMASVEETRSVVDDLRQQMSKIETMMPQVSTKELPASGDLRKEIADRKKAEKIPLEFNQSLKVTPNGTSQ